MTDALRSFMYPQRFATGLLMIDSEYGEGAVEECFTRLMNMSFTRECSFVMLLLLRDVLESLIIRSSQRCDFYYKLVSSSQSSNLIH